MNRVESLRQHAQALLGLAETSRGEDRACLVSAAREWLRIAAKLETVEQHWPQNPNGHHLEIHKERYTPVVRLV